LVLAVLALQILLLLEQQDKILFLLHSPPRVAVVVAH
jgi:hypothetical protein